MADKNLKHPENIPGIWYVDTNCINCGLCSDRAPGVFRPSAGHEQHIVFKQPQSAEELEESESARESCPADSIGRDDEWVKGGTGASHDL